MSAHRVKFSAQSSCDTILLLEQLLQPSFGPDGLRILLESSDGHIGCINSGFQLVPSLKYKNFVGMLLTESVKQLHKAIGDGSKKFILMLAAVLREMLSAYGELNTVACGQALSDMSCTLTETVIPSLTRSQVGLQYSVLGNLDGETLQDMCLHLAKTCIGNRYSSSLKDIILQIICTLINPSSKEDDLSVKELSRNIHNCDSNLDEMIAYIPGVPSCESKVFPGFVIERSFLVEPALPLENFGVLLLLSGMELDEEDNTSILNVNSKIQLSEVMDEFIGFKEKIVRFIASCGIRLVLSGKKIDSTTAHFMRLHSIGAIQMIPEETLWYIAAACGTHPYLTAWHFDGRCLIKGVYGSYKTIGHLRVINLQCKTASKNCSLLPSPYAIALCGATIGTCRQLAKQIHQLLRVIASWCHEVPDEGYLCTLRACGTWEIAVVRKLERYLRNDLIRGSVKWVVCKAMQQAFLTIPLTLLKNANCTETRNKLKTYDMIFNSAALEKNIALGVDIEQGCLRHIDDLPQSSAWETYWSQVVLVQCVCNTLNKLLKIDMVVKVPRCIKVTLAQEEQESDEDED